MGQIPNNLNNIEFGGSNRPIKKSVKRLLSQIDTVQSKVSPDHNKNNISDITPNGQNEIEYIPKPKPAPPKSSHVHIVKPIPKP